MKRMRLFTGKDILFRFKRYTEEAVRIRIATAWATSGKQLDALKQKKGLEVHAIVGTYGNITKPSALEHLKKLGKLRLAKDASLFHPKIYVFEFKNGASRAWVGSANFTGRGFGGGNVEIMYETDDVELFLKWFEQQWKQSDRASQKAIDDYRKRREKDPPSRTFLEVGESEGATPEPSLLPEEQNWEPVYDSEEIQGAFKRMRTTLTDRPGVEEVMRNGRTVYWRPDLRYWCAFSQRDHGYWNAFGPGNPWESNRFSNGCLQINPPFDGNSKKAGKYTGLFVRNDSGGIFLARNLNRIQEVNAEDLERRLNERLPGRIVDVPWPVPWKKGNTRRMVVLGEVDSGELRDAVAELVRLVAELKGAGTGAGGAP